MSAVQNTSKACCTIPGVVSDYTPKGSYVAYGGFDRVYVTGPAASDIVLICVYDIFGFKPQTQQGADIVAEQLQVKLLMPDFFEPSEPWPMDKFPVVPSSPEFKAFFGGPANPPRGVEGLKRVAEALKKDGAKKVVAYGFCWGGKVAIVAGSGSTPLDAVAIVHPALLSAADAEGLSVPLGLYLSKDEDETEYKKMLDIVGQKPFASKNDTKRYTTMHHGWAAARADLKNEENKKEFEDLYSTLIAYIKNAV